MKVFTNNQIPSNIHQCIMEVTAGFYCNNVFIRWDLGDTAMPIRSNFDSEEEYFCATEDWSCGTEQDAWTVTQWLLTQGCKLDDEVLVEHSW